MSPKLYAPLLMVNGIAGRQSRCGSRETPTHGAKPRIRSALSEYASADCVYFRMAEYRCHNLEDGQRRSEVAVEAPDDATMLLEAEFMLGTSRFVTMEIWQDSRPVGRVPIRTPEELTHAKAGRTHKRPADKSRN